MGLSLSLYNALRPSMGRTDSAADPNLAPTPTGPVVWIHAPRSDDHAIVEELIEEFADLNPDVWFVITTHEPPRPYDEDQCVWVTLPPDTAKGIAPFLEHWRPSVLAWLSGTLHPTILAETANSGAHLFMIDTGESYAAATQLRFWPGLRRATLQLFEGFVIGDQLTAEALKAAGAPWKHTEVTGVLEKDVPALPCNEAERDTLATLLNTRPVWLAAGINLAELEAVLAAHRQAMRRAHRLLLIVVPKDPEEAELYANLIAAQDFIFSQRSLGGEPEPDCHVYLADTDEEYGLWYRLSPVSFVGHTIANWTEPGPNPFDAAALGSVVLHGPGLQPFQNAFHRLSRAHASEQVSHAGDLALAVEAMQSPERAAERAHAAWQISTAGAEVLDRVVTLLDKAVKRHGQRK